MKSSRPVCSSSLRRNFRRIESDKFRQLLMESSVYVTPKSDVDGYANQLNDDLIKILDELAPLKKITRRCGKQTRGWLSVDVIEARRSRRRLERRYRRSKCETDRVSYRSACRTTNKLINESRKNYVSARLAEATGNPHQRWKIANELLHRSHSKPDSDSDAPSTIEARCISFCQFFVDKLVIIAHKIDEQLKLLPLPSLPIFNFVEPTAFEIFCVVTSSDVQRLIANCQSKSSPLDIIPVVLVKSCSDIFGVLLARLANMSFTEGVFPSIFKLGQVTPLLKKQGLTAGDPGNYRPITNLCTFGKILERLAQQQLRSHINTSPNNNSQQSAYRAFHSTETAMIKVVSDLLTNVDSGSPSLLLSLDISAAFDTLNHDCLLQRAEDLFGFTGKAKSWLASYLTGRSSFVGIC